MALFALRRASICFYFFSQERIDMKIFVRQHFFIQLFSNSVGIEVYILFNRI